MNTKSNWQNRPNSRDHIERLLNSTIQHGPLNRRVYLMKPADIDIPAIIRVMDQLCREKGYEKILAKVPETHKTAFLKAGYVQEASVPGYFKQCSDALFLCKYHFKDRAAENHPDRVRESWKIIHEKKDQPHNGIIRRNDINVCRTSDAGEMSQLYRRVFQSYPFPIYDPGYIIDTMASHIKYFKIRKNGRIVAVASGEMDRENESVEMTDFAVLPNYQRKGMALSLLLKMEAEMKKAGIRTAFTIARTMSIGMNVTFGRMGYTLSGKLVNNTHISGGIESMWVWHKKLQ